MYANWLIPRPCCWASSCICWWLTYAICTCLSWGRRNIKRRKEEALKIIKKRSWNYDLKAQSPFLHFSPTHNYENKEWMRLHEKAVKGANFINKSQYATYSSLKMSAWKITTYYWRSWKILISFFPFFDVDEGQKLPVTARWRQNRPRKHQKECD